jgi:hypothetical protein
MKYVIMYVYDALGTVENTYGILPGQMFEYARCESLEQAQVEAQAFNPHGGHLLILSYFEVEPKQSKS